MILNVSGRTDIVAFYMKWFMNRYREGFLDVRNPFNPKMVSRIQFKNVDAIIFCTKNPIPILKYIHEIQKPVLFHVTLTPYKNDIEPNVISKKRIVEAVKQLSGIIGADNLFIRYDPVFLNEKYTVEYHIKAFERMCALLDGCVNRIIISFIDDCKNVRKHHDLLNVKDFMEEDYQMIGTNFSVIAHRHHMRVQTCFENRNLKEYGFDIGECFSHKKAFELTGKTFKNWTARKEKKCNCVQMVDIGAYNSCKHFCKYCYANFDEKQVNINFNHHNPDSSLLIGELSRDDIIKERV